MQSEQNNLLDMRMRPDPVPPAPVDQARTKVRILHTRVHKRSNSCSHFFSSNRFSSVLNLGYIILHTRHAFSTAHSSLHVSVPIQLLCCATAAAATLHTLITIKLILSRSVV